MMPIHPRMLRLRCYRSYAQHERCCSVRPERSAAKSKGHPQWITLSKEPYKRACPGIPPVSSSPPGFSVLELVVAMSVAGLFYGALYSFYHLHAQTMKVQEVKLDLQEGSRLAIDFLVRELPLAGARPVRGSPCEGFERLTEASSQRLVLQYDYRGNSAGSPPDGCPDDPNERIVYTYESSTQLIKRGTGSGSPQPFIADVPPDGFLLHYFDRDGNELGSDLTATQREAVNSIVVTVRTSKRHPDPRVGEPLTSELSSTIFLPNPAR